MADEVPAQPQTRRADRSVASRLAPAAVLLLGLVYVVAAVVRTDDIYASDPGVLLASQVAPTSLDFSYQLQEVVRALQERSSEESAPADSVEWTDAVRLDARSLVDGEGDDGEGADVSLVDWKVGRDRVVAVAVARFTDAEAAARARGAAGAVESRGSVAGQPAARATWPAGKHLLVGVVASATDQAAADDELARSRRQVTTSVGLARVFWYEVLALGPLLLLFLVWASARWIFFLAVVLLTVVAGVAYIVVLVPVLLVVVVRRLLARRRSPAPEGPDHDAGLVTAPLERPTVSYWHIRVPGVWLSASGVERGALLAVIVVIGVGIAVLTVPLFPGSVTWGSVVLAAVGVAPAWARRFPSLRWVRKVVRWLLVVAVGSVALGFAPDRLFGNPVLQVAVAGIGLVVLVVQWRDLTADTKLSYSKWYEDVDARSTLFLLGAAVLTIGAGSLFLGSNGAPDLGTQLVEKGLAAAGLLVALSASANVRAARDAAQRERARKRGTPPVVYLRSFGDDELTVVSPRMQRSGLERLSWRRRELFEDVIARALSRTGPVVAIARPGTGQRDLGPARDLILTDDWLGAVKTYMGDAILVAVVLGKSDGLVTELETLGELGLLDRMCLFVPPVGDAEVADRLAVLGRQAGYSNAWGPLHEDRKHPIVALASIGATRSVVTASKRTAFAYRRCIAEMPVLRPPADRSKGSPEHRPADGGRPAI